MNWDRSLNNSSGAADAFVIVEGVGITKTFKICRKTFKICRKTFKICRNQLYSYFVWWWTFQVRLHHHAFTYGFQKVGYWQWLRKGSHCHRFSRGTTRFIPRSDERLENLCFRRRMYETMAENDYCITSSPIFVVWLLFFSIHMKMNIQLV